MRARTLAAALAVVVLSAPALPPLARAQQPAAPSSSGPDLFAESMKTTGPLHRTDAYDVAAGAMNVIRPPLKVGLCAVGLAAGAAVFGVTLGTAYKAAAEAIHEGCGGKWLLSGDDIRPTRTHDGWTDQSG